MTQTTTWTLVGAFAWEVPAGVTRGDVTVAGTPGFSRGSVRGGRAAIIGDRLGFTPGDTHSIQVGSPAGGGSADPAIPGRGGSACSWDSTLIAGAGGGAGSPIPQPFTGAGASNPFGGDAGGPGMDGQDGANAGTSALGGHGGRADGTPGAGGTGFHADGNPGSGGVGGDGALYDGMYSGAGGAGLAGGGSGGVTLSSGTEGSYLTSGGGGGGASKGGVLKGMLDPGSSGFVSVTVASAPYPPALVGPVGAAVVDRQDVVRLSFAHRPASTSDLDALTRYDIQWRPIGGAWVTINGVAAQQYHEAPAGTFPDGMVEWRARTYSDGIPGEWSPADQFLAASRNTPPVISVPAADAELHGARVETMFTGDFDRFQVRIVGATAAGTVDESIIYADSGLVLGSVGEYVSRLARDQVTAFVQVRVRVATTAWSTWAQVRVFARWVLPPAPRGAVATDPARGRMTVQVVNDSATDPLVDHVDIYVVEGGVEAPDPEGRIAPNSSWTYWTPKSCVETGFRLVAVVGESDAEASSEVIY